MEKAKNFYGEEASIKILEGVHQNAFDFMDERTRDLDDYIAMTYFGNEISYRAFKKETYRYVNRLKRYGLEMGDTISLCLPNVPEVVYYKYAAWILGIKTNLIDPRFNPDGIKTSVELSHSKLLVSVVDIFKEKLSGMIDKLNVENIVLVAPSDSMKKEITDIRSVLARRLYDYKEFMLFCQDKNFRSSRVILNQAFMKGVPSEKVKSVYLENMDASIVFTSGTTGTPKGAVLTHDAYNTKINQITYAVPNIDPGDRFLAAIPFFSAYGSFAGMHNSFVKGMNSIMIPKLKPNEFADLMFKYRINTAIGVPKYWEDFVAITEENKRKYKCDDLSFIKNPVSGGDVIPEQLMTSLDNLLEKENSQGYFIGGYGSSEVAGPVATTVKEEGYYDPHSTGVLFPGVDYLFLDPETGEIIPDGNKGDLCISDPGMMDRYLDDEKATEEITVYHDGKKYYKMGDLFEINKLGLMYFRGRSKRVIMRPDGHTVHSLPIEEAALIHGSVKKCCAVGVKKMDNSSGAIPVAFVVLKDGIIASEELVQELDAIALNNLSERNRALAFTFVPELPYTLMGKVAYKELEKNKLEELDLYVVDDTFITGQKLVKRKGKK